MAAGSEARVLAKAGGSSTIVSKRVAGQLALAQIVERVGDHELHVGDGVARAILLAPGAARRPIHRAATTDSARRARCSANEPW